ncbi:MAG: NHL repeat-containing protein, partial [Nitrospinota bacterium]
MGERKRIKVLVPVAALVAVTVTGLVVYISISRAGTGVETRAFEVSLVIGGEGVEPGKLRHPSGIAVDRLKRTYVVDTLNHRVQVFDAQGNPLMVLGEGEPQNGSLYLPEDVAISPAGSIYVADTGNNRIQFYAPDGKYMGRIPAQQAPQTSFSSPGGIAFDGEGNLYVVDTGNNRIL